MLMLQTTASGDIDLVLDSAGGFADEETLTTAVIISLLSDRRANPDDVLPYLKQPPGPLPPDRRGWCGDALSVIDGDRTGSRLWLLARSKQTQETLNNAIDYATEALQWMIDDGKAVEIDINASWTAIGRMDMVTSITMPSGNTLTIALPTGGPYAL